MFLTRNAHWFHSKLGSGIHTGGVTQFSLLSLQSITSAERAKEIISGARRKMEESAHKYPPGRFEQYKLQFDRLERGGLTLENVVLPGFVCPIGKL